MKKLLGVIPNRIQLKSLPPSLDKLSILSLSWSRSISSKKHTEHSQYKLRNSTTHLFFTLTNISHACASIVLSKLQQNICFVDRIQSTPLNGPRKVLNVTSQLQSLQMQANTNLKSAPSTPTVFLLRKWFEPRSNIPWLKKIIWVIGVLRRTVVSDWRFDNLCGGHLQSQVVVLVENSKTLVSDLIGQ